MGWRGCPCLCPADDCWTQPLSAEPQRRLRRCKLCGDHLPWFVLYPTDARCQLPPRTFAVTGKKVAPTRGCRDNWLCGPACGWSLCDKPARHDRRTTPDLAHAIFHFRRGGDVGRRDDCGAGFMEKAAGTTLPGVAHSSQLFGDDCCPLNSDPRCPNRRHDGSGIEMGFVCFCAYRDMYHNGGYPFDKAIFVSPKVS